MEKFIEKISKSLIPMLLLFSSLASCGKITATLNFEVKGSGFHRNIEYQINLQNFAKNESMCFLALHLQLSPALYVNVDEIADLQRLGVTTACSSGEIDVEKFKETAGHQDVTICTAILHSSFVTVSLPIHQRYQTSRANGKYVNETLPNPKLLIGCGERLKENRVSKIDLCTPCVHFARKWREIPWEVEKDEFVWMVPVGDLEHISEIVCITLLTTISGSIYLIFTIWQSHS